MKPKQHTGNCSGHAAAALAAALALAAFPVAAQGTAKGGAASDPAAAALVRGFEDKLNLEGLDVTNTFTFVQKKAAETDRVLRVRIFRRDAVDAFTLIFQFPDSEKGKGYYRSKDDLFLYLPSTREFVYRNRKDDVGSTDVRTDLFGKSRLLDQYRATLAGQARVSKWDCDIVRLDALQLDVSFPVQKWYLRKGDGLPVKVENFSASETLLRTSYYVDYQDLGKGKYIFTKLLSVDALEKGQQTYLTNDAISTSRIQDYVFSKAFLEEQSR
ncbi:MAG: outer membrane lipoprotein-sorting protein [Spirochaetes bacterium]|nr:outer membrane lipoprotein-sorting protein [Spirochaetota bacterium]